MPEVWRRYKITAKLLEDAHPGSGSGAAGIDALVARDRNEYPVIWASHLEGLLRDEARRLLGNIAAQRLFGSAGGQRQAIIFTSLFAGAKTGARVWRSAARQSFSNRAPKDDTLRAIEYVPAGTSFIGHAEVAECQLGELSRLLLETDAIGHGRAAGAGRVAFQIESIEPTPHPPSGAQNGRIRVLLQALDPLCITATATPTNLIPTMPYAPGRSVLGALANWLWCEGHTEEAKLLVSGRVGVSDALPLPDVADGLAYEVCPAPLSLLSRRAGGSAGPVPWWAQRAQPVQRLNGIESQQNDKREGKLERPERDLFVCRSGPGGWIAFRPKKRVRLRNGRTNPEAPDPSLFALEQITEKTRFLTDLSGNPADMAALSAALMPVLTGARWLRLGRGGTPVEVEAARWEPPPQAVKADGPLWLTLVSDLLVRDDKLRWVERLTGTALSLAGRPGASDSPARDVHLTSDKEQRQEAVAIYGFNGTSRLWRNPATAIRHGSVFRIEGEGVSELATMSAQGHWLGERTNEGFGRFRLDPKLPGFNPTASRNAPETGLASPLAADDPLDAIAQGAHEWFEKHRELARTGSSEDRRPSLSQWMDFIVDLENDSDTAIAERTHPRTAGMRSWKHRHADAVLQLLQQRPPGDRAQYARMFVRWLRAEMRREAN